MGSLFIPMLAAGIVLMAKNPMYSAAIQLFLCMPRVLGSFISLFIFLVYPAIIVRRIYSEEQLLERELPGYAAYRKKVRFRLIPYIW